MKLTHGAAACLLCVACEPMAVGGCKINQIAEWSVENSGNRLLVDGHLDGRPVKVLIDTGASMSFVWGGAARRLGLPLRSVTGLRVYGVGGETQPMQTSVRQLQIGAFVGKGLNLLVLGTRGAEARDPAFVLGDDFFSKFSTEFDLAHGVIRLLQPEDCRLDELPYWTHTYSMAELTRTKPDDPKILTEVKLHKLLFTYNGGAVFQNFQSESAQK
jgi:hypothetical protein